MDNLRYGENSWQRPDQYKAIHTQVHSVLSLECNKYFHLDITVVLWLPDNFGYRRSHLPARKVNLAYKICANVRMSLLTDSPKRLPTCRGRGFNLRSTSTCLRRICR